MNGRRVSGAGFTRVVGLAVEAVLLGLLAFWLASRITGHPSAATAIGWMTTLAAVSVGAVLSYVLAHDDTQDTLASTDTARCGSCGHVVVHDWRLCPYCGTFVEDRPVAAAGSAGDTTLR